MTAPEKLYQNSDQQPLLGIVDTDGTTRLPVNGYANARYVVYSTTNGVDTLLFEKTLVDGLTVSVDNLSFVADIVASDVPLSGNFMHQLRVGNTATELLPPNFERAVYIEPAY